LNKEYVINNISDYLKLINLESLNNFIFRGQNQPYNGIEASGLRSNPRNRGGAYDIEKMKQQYYNKVIRKISDEEKKHFLAFCQHHSLPTNLVDFTTSPLIALFFACYGQPTFFTNRIDLEAEVYLINKDKLIDITSYLVEFEHDNFFILLSENQNVQKKVLHELESMFVLGNQNIHQAISNIISCYNKNKINIYGESTIEEDDDEDFDLPDGLHSLNDYNDQIELIDLYSYVYSELDDEKVTHSEIYHIDFPELATSQQLGTRIYLALLINLLQIQQISSEVLNIELDIYFTYLPPDLFDRIVNQKGLFIYQPYILKKDELSKCEILSYQSINPDYTIKIQNHHEI